MYEGYEENDMFSRDSRGLIPLHTMNKIVCVGAVEIQSC